MENGGEGTGVVFEFERAAMRGGEMPDGLTRKEQDLFLALRELYHQCHVGVITREIGVADKKKMVQSFEREEKTETFHAELAKHCAELWKNVECAASDYRKERTLENADRIMAAIYGTGEVKKDV